MTPDLWWKRYAERREYKAGQMIFMQGDPAEEVFVVSEGRVVINKHTDDGQAVALAYRGAGEMFGEIALIHDSPRTASATAIQETTVRVLGRDAFWKLMESDREFPRLIMETVIERLLASDEIRVQAELWERQVADRFARLRNENERMAEIMQLRRETMHFIVHDLRNPIGLAGTALELVESAPDFDPNSDSTRLLGMAKLGLSRMLHLVDSLLDVERLDEGADALALTRVDLLALAGAVIENQQPLARASEVKLAARLPADLPPIQADYSRLERVIVNLLDNALKFTPPGGTITLIVQPDPAHQQVVIAVNDTGPGIPDDQRERIFDRFVQAEVAHRSRGFGLGLAYCRSAVEAHGGTITAEGGEGGVGTKVVVRLPVR